MRSVCELHNFGTLTGACMVVISNFFEGQQPTTHLACKEIVEAGVI
jgi:hypothetical protein